MRTGMKRKGWGEGCEVWGAPLTIQSISNTKAMLPSCAAM